MMSKQAIELTPRDDARQTKSGPPLSIDELVDLHHETLIRVCYGITGNEDATRDAVQSAWEIALKKLDTVRNPDRIGAWLVAVAANEARRIMRSGRRHEALVPRLEASDPSASHDLDLVVAVARLTPQDRVLLALHYASGLTSAEIGTVIGLTAEGVRTRHRRLLRRLKADMEDRP